MKRTLMILVTIAMVALTLFSSCRVTRMPSTFVKAVDGGEWNSILIREDLSYEKAFNEVLDVCAKRFEMELISKEGGYGRTNWIYTWNTGNYSDKYRTRVIFKFSADRTKVNIRTEAEFNGYSGWERGYDTRLLQTIKQDISGIIGRTVL